MEERNVDVHPLQRHDPECIQYISFLRLAFLENEMRVPSRRAQDLPPEAFGRLDAHSVLVALSHGWFYQCHPDPEGIKLKILREYFIPRLRRMYPHTNILVFYDYHSTPQRPRTKREDETFAGAMKHMNSVYMYCDTVLFVETTIPSPDMTLYETKVVPASFRWVRFIDACQVGDVLSRENAKNDSSQLSQNDIVREMNGTPITDIEKFRRVTKTSTLRFLRRPFGRQNMIENKDRGWLYLERLTTAVKAAAAPQESFDRIIMSNSSDLKVELYQWAQRLRIAVNGSNREASLNAALKSFKVILDHKQFTSKNDKHIVHRLMGELIEEFETSWDDHCRIQKDMGTRAREILLRWGEFSESYIESAGLRSGGSSVTNVCRLTALAVVPPMLAIVPFVLPFMPDPNDEDSWWISSIWLGAELSLILTALTPTINMSFASIPLGVHTARFFASQTFVSTMWSVLLRASTSLEIIPMEIVIVTLMTVAVFETLFTLKIIPVRDDKTGEQKLWNLGSWLHMPAHQRFDLQTRANVKRVILTSIITCIFGLSYPLLGAVFVRSGYVIQACLVPVFFAMRAIFEYAVDNVTARTFGSDGLPIMSFAGVSMHEICLSVLLTNIKHPLVFAILVFSDVFENMFCLYSLWRIVSPRRQQIPIRSMTNKVAPASDVSCYGEAAKKEETTKEENGDRPRKRMHKPARKALVKRSSDTYSLMRELTNDDVNNDSADGTALFIVTILLQRELVETMIPIQALMVISTLHNVGIDTNSLVAGWDNSDLHQAILYIVIDLAVEIVVFASTILVLLRLFPKIQARNVILGVVGKSIAPMAMISLSAWSLNLLYQSTYGGIDLTFRFSWLYCDDANSTWLRGYDWVEGDGSLCA